MSGFIGRNVLPLALGAVLIVGGTAFGVSQSNALAGLEQQEQQVTQLEQTLAQHQSTVQTQTEENVFGSLGVTASRLSTDQETLTSLLQIALTWDSGESYEDARASLQTRFGLGVDSGFLKDFMPAATFNQDDSGKRYYYLDSVGLNSSLSGDPTVEVVKVLGTDYTYAVMADVTMSSDTGLRTNADGSVQATPSVERRVLLYVTVDGDGGLSDLSGIPASGTTRSSG